MAVRSGPMNNAAGRENGMENSTPYHRPHQAANTRQGRSGLVGRQDPPPTSSP